MKVPNTLPQGSRIKAHLLRLSLLCGAMMSSVASAAEDASALKMGDPAPALTVGKWIKGEPVTKLETGKIYVLDFWATWCGPSVKAMPQITAMQKQFPEIVFIGVNVRERAPENVVPFVEKMGDKMDYRVVLDHVPVGNTDGQYGKMNTGWLAPAGVKGLPASIVVGKDGKILWIGDPGQLEPVLTSVAAGKALVVEAADEVGEQKLEKILKGGETGVPIVEILAGLEALGKEHPKILPEIQKYSVYILLMELNQPEKAYKVAAQMLETCKDRPDLLSEIAYGLMMLSGPKKNLPLAVQLAEQAVNASGGEDPLMLEILARAHFEVGRVKAGEVMRKAVALGTDNPFREDFGGNMGEYMQDKLDNYMNYDPEYGTNYAAEDEKIEEENAPTLKVGDPAPPLTVGKWIKGEPIEAFEAGKIYVLEFWATWCAPCVEAIPHLTALQKQYPEMAFIGVDVWENVPQKVAPFVEKMGDKMDYRVALDDVPKGESNKNGKMAMGWLKAAGVNGIPKSMIVGKDGKILWIGHPSRLDPVLKAVAADKAIEPEE